MFNITNWAEGYFWGFVSFPVAWYFAKPALTRLYQDAIYYINPLLAKVTSYQLPVI